MKFAPPDVVAEVRRDMSNSAAGVTRLPHALTRATIAEHPTGLCALRADVSAVCLAMSVGSRETAALPGPIPALVSAVECGGRNLKKWRALGGRVPADPRVARPRLLVPPDPATTRQSIEIGDDGCVSRASTSHTWCGSIAVVRTVDGVREAVARHLHNRESDSLK